MIAATAEHRIASHSTAGRQSKNQTEETMVDRRTFTTLLAGAIALAPRASFGQNSMTSKSDFQLHDFQI
jgi:hypothetical protein